MTGPGVGGATPPAAPPSPTIQAGSTRSSDIGGLGTSLNRPSKTVGYMASLKPGTLAQATITGSGMVVTLQFRPEQITWSKTNSWEPHKVKGTEMQEPDFTGGMPIGLTLSDLWFDTNEEPPGNQDVRKVTGKLWKMMNVDPSRKETQTQLGEPPHVTFRWGRMWTFEAVILTINETFTLFRPDGTPVRSKVTLSLQQAKKEGVYPGQNPTSGGRQGYAVHIVQEGETIDWIAYREYGNSNAWRHLAAANNLDEPNRLRPGQRLLLVPINP